MVAGRVVRVPLQPYRVRGIAEALVRPILRIEVQARNHTFKVIEFRVDCATAITTLSAARAADLGIQVPRKIVTLTVETAAGLVTQRRHPGRITVRIPGLEMREFNWPCHFIHEGEPSSGPLLGLAGVLEDLRITLDGAYSLDAPYGWLILEETAQPAR
jgi:hypothetical protein